MKPTDSWVVYFYILVSFIFVQWTLVSGMSCGHPWSSSTLLFKAYVCDGLGIFLGRYLAWGLAVTKIFYDVWKWFDMKK